MNGAAGEEVSILVVDDSAFSRLLLQRRLAELGYTRVATAEDGLQGLAAMEAGGHDVVLLDIEMPNLDGIGVLERLRAAGRTEPPVIVISALSELSAVVRCIELGAEDYLPKSFEPPLLRARLGAVLEKKRLRDLAARRLALLEAELESARAAQLALVPADFAAVTAGTGTRLHAAMVPARQVGGDFYDALRLDDRRLFFAIADVTGKGASASLTMARGFGLMRAAARRMAAAEGEVDPGAVLAVANDDLARENETQTFVTAVAGVLDLHTGEGRIAVAGHDPPLRLAPGGAAPELLATPGRRQPALGIMEGLPYASAPLRLAPGEALLLYTDGVTEAEAADGSFFGRERLIEVTTPLAAEGPERIVAEVLRAVDAFATGMPQADDITALALRFQPPPG